MRCVTTVFEAKSLPRPSRCCRAKPLDNYLQPNEGKIADHPDVHGNQVGLLQKSRCYLSSPKMSCSTCHDVHQPERPAAAYSDRCLSCHQVESCGMSKTMGHKIADNCIDCHMPVERPMRSFLRQRARLSGRRCEITGSRFIPEHWRNR